MQTSNHHSLSYWFRCLTSIFKGEEYATAYCFIIFQRNNLSDQVSTTSFKFSGNRNLRSFRIPLSSSYPHHYPFVRAPSSSLHHYPQSLFSRRNKKWDNTNQQSLRVWLIGWKHSETLTKNGSCFLNINLQQYALNLLFF